MTPAESQRVAFRRCAAALLIAALVSACSVAPVAPVAHEPKVADPVRESPAPAAYTRSAPAASATLPAEPKSGPPAAGSGVRLPPLESAGLDEVLVVRDPLPIARAIDLTASPDDLWVRIRHGFGMPNLSSPLVLDRQIWYASRPSAIKLMLQRSRRYLYHIVEELERRGMPTELALLPMVESAFNPMAYSRAKASGLWQFIPSTGKTYNLQQNWWYDARRDIVASTSAALDYLQFLYEMHGDWQLALASYNWGENAVARAIDKNKARRLPTDYLSLTMPAETRYYVPKLQALKNIVANPAAFGIDLDPIPNEPYFVTVEKTQDIGILTAAKLAEMPVEELIALNPAYNRPVMTAAQSQALVLPADRAAIFKANLENHDQPLSSWRAYTMKPGEKLDRVAARHGIPLARLKKVNGIGPRTKIRTGQQIVVPVKGSNAAKEPLPAVFQPPAVPEPRTRKVVYTVKKGDTLPTIAHRYRVSTAELRRWNRIGRLTAGQKIVIQKQVAGNTRAPVRKRKTSKAAKPDTRPAAVAKPAQKAGRR
jgi:membrane-bound lytic murein transglycosylase D